MPVQNSARGTKCTATNAPTSTRLWRSARVHRRAPPVARAARWADSDRDATGDDATGDDATGDDATGDDATGDDVTGDDATGDDVGEAGGEGAIIPAT